MYSYETLLPFVQVIFDAKFYRIVKFLYRAIPLLWKMMFPIGYLNEIVLPLHSIVG